ncbi:MAG: FAD-dependent oxidoreductase [Desulfobacteraceae bacterium]|jgi:D-amino-acid dehydrogenase
MLNRRHSEVVVIGGGIIGLACAYYLNRAGREVCLIDKATVGGEDGACYGNCGLLFFSDLPPLCQPGAVADALIRMTRRSSPLYINPQPDLPRLMWLLKFAAKCNHRHFRHALAARHALFSRSRELYTTLFAKEPIDCQWGQQGVLLVFKDRARLEQYRKINAALQPFGVAASRLSRSQLLEKEPALTEDVCGAWYHPIDGHLRPEALLSELRDLLIDRGATIVEQSPVTRLVASGGAISEAVTSKGRFCADHFVLAAGAWSPAIARQVGLRVPVQPGKGYSLTMARPKTALRTPCYFWERSVVATPWRDGFRLGGTMEFSGLNTEPDRRRSDNLASAAAAYLREPTGRPVMAQWVGVRPMCYDDLPIIGAAPKNANLFIATGHGMIGLTAATATAELVTAMIAGKTTAIDPRPYRPTRFTLAVNA